METSLTKLLKIEHPIILAPMAGGPSSVALTAEVSNQGGLGSYGGNYLTPENLQKAIHDIKAQTTKPFAVNIFIPNTAKEPTAEHRQEMLDFTNDVRKKLDIAPLRELPVTTNYFSAQIEVILKEKPDVFSFVFGLLDRDILKNMKDRGITVIGTGSTLDEALALQEEGVDAIVLQGFEGGGHRGVFATNEDYEVPLKILLESVRGKLRTPYIASGAIMDGKDIKEALQLGASAVQMGTAFLLCAEAGTSKCYREALLSKNAANTDITIAFSGRRARGIVNHYMREFKAKSKVPLPFPIQNTLTQDIRKKATELGVADYCSLWSGTGASRIRELSVKDLMHALVEEMK